MLRFQAAIIEACFQQMAATQRLTDPRNYARSTAKKKSAMPAMTGAAKTQEDV